MFPEEENSRRKEERESTQQEQNSGNIGRETESEQDPENDSYVIKNRQSQEQVNEDGKAENEGDHWSGDYGQKSSNFHNASAHDQYTDPDKQPGYPKKGYNHVDNPGGTSEEDERKNTMNLRDDEADRPDPFDADGSRL